MFHVNVINGDHPEAGGKPIPPRPENEKACWETEATDSQDSDGSNKEPEKKISPMKLLIRRGHFQSRVHLTFTMPHNFWDTGTILKFALCASFLFPPCWKGLFLSPISGSQPSQDTERVLMRQVKVDSGFL